MNFPTTPTDTARPEGLLTRDEMVLRLLAPDPEGREALRARVAELRDKYGLPADRQVYYRAADVEEFAVSSQVRSEFSMSYWTADELCRLFRLPRVLIDALIPAVVVREGGKSFVGCPDPGTPLYDRERVAAAIRAAGMVRQARRLSSRPRCDSDKSESPVAPPSPRCDEPTRRTVAAPAVSAPARLGGVRDLIDRKLATWRSTRSPAGNWSVADAAGCTVRDGLTYEAAKAYCEATVAAGGGTLSICCPPRPLPLNA